MKNKWLPVLVIMSFLSSCTKESKLNLPEDNGCIERRMLPVNSHGISSTDIPTLNALFQNNNIDNSTYRYYQYIHQTVQTYFPPYASFDDKIVKVDEYTNGLRIFTGQLVFSFKDNVLSFKGGEPTKGTSLNTTALLTLGQLRKLFIGHIEQFDKRGSYFQDSCFTAEFGYYNLNAGTSYSAENLVKAWRVTLKDRVYPSEYPIAYYEDTDGKLIYYDNGIRTFR